jgi:hypothetical protein
VTGDLFDGELFASCATATVGMHKTQKKATNHALMISGRLHQDKGGHLGGFVGRFGRMLNAKR